MMRLFAPMFTADSAEASNTAQQLWNNNVFYMNTTALGSDLYLKHFNDSSNVLLNNTDV